MGCGYWGNNFLRVIQNSDSATLVKVCDTDIKRADALSSKHAQINFTSDVDQIIYDSQIEAVVICTPVSTHFNITEKLLLAGKHVLCEKPLTKSADQCEYLYQLAKKQKVKLLVGHVFEYNSVVQHMKRVIQRNEIGPILYFQFTRVGLGPVRNDANVVFDLAAHDVSLAISLMGKMPIAVVANGSCFLQDQIEDVAFIQLEFADHVYATINVSWLDPIKQRLVKVVGSRKMLLFDDVSVSEKLKIIETGKNYQEQSGDFGTFQLSVKDGEILIPNLQHPEPLVTEFHHFTACIRGSEEPLTDARYAAKVVKVLEAAQASILENGKRVLI